MVVDLLDKQFKDLASCSAPVCFLDSSWIPVDISFVLEPNLVAQCQKHLCLLESLSMQHIHLPTVYKGSPTIFSSQVDF